MRKIKRTAGRKTKTGARRTGSSKAGARRPAKVHPASRKAPAGSLQKRITELKGKVKDLEARLQKSMAESAELRKALAGSRTSEGATPPQAIVSSAPTTEPSGTGTL